MTYDLPRLVSGIVVTIALVCLGVMWIIFFSMLMSPDRAVEIRANDFNEFWIEFLLLTFGIIFMPVALYELEERL